MRLMSWHTILYDHNNHNEEKEPNIENKLYMITLPCSSLLYKQIRMTHSEVQACHIDPPCGPDDPDDKNTLVVLLGLQNENLLSFLMLNQVDLQCR